MTACPDLRLILAAHAERLPFGRAKSGFLPMSADKAVRSLENAGLWFGPRRELEEREDYRQIIPYIVLVAQDRLVQYTRTPAGGEARLHGRISIGLGGHVDLADAVSTVGRFDLFATIERTAERELLEELGAVTCSRRRWVGLLADSDSAVGRVHIGLVGIWSVENIQTAVAEDAVGDVTTRSITDLKEDASRLETWSSLLLPWLEEVMSQNEYSFETI